ncbi:uroporphyrinogen-III C-methyltransferase [Sphingobacterium sp. N143]|uniref:uroporphyrinogen-III C-methyltransferase n=1 Tax=Sphingobacterium sp. N143 TaxID=2746727 RepID=UPI00257911DF|nr:uroporphyrinogen-III C-methyltransferase [Sphingobacterium sp. N143]MDM1295259.1 uroporphyrinogen-III C-methyltransferase [Sphingobacterium sp. N143]
MKKLSKTSLFIVGSGPGDPELLTMKAYKAVKSAQVILYDNLINEEILQIANKNCVKHYVGKHPYGKYVPQEEINELILHYCDRYDRVVRLKGGDPYLFGRGFEEWLTVQGKNIAVSYIPGISSMQGAGINDIPLTHRGISEGVWALTGMKKDGSLSADLPLAVQSRSTVVIYMGMRKLDEIARTYVLYGRGETPAAIIQHASLPQQKQVLCKAKDLVRASKEHGLGHPAIIVIGAVVDLQHAHSLAVAHRSIV